MSSNLKTENNMKKVILFAAVATAFSFASCKQEHDCKCSSTTTFGATTSPAATSTVTYKDVTKRHAKTLCVSSTETDANGAVTTSTCTVD